jgi:hypothetical protein
VKGKETKISKERIGSILVIKFVIEEIFFYKVLNYEICLTSLKDSPVRLTAMQNEVMNLLPAYSDQVV